MGALRSAPRLSPDASQAAFRVLLSTLAAPGRIYRLAELPEVPPATLLPLVLADFTCTVALVGDAAAEVEPWLTLATGAVTGPPCLADQIVVLEPGAASASLVEDLRTGSAMVPEEGARLAISVPDLGSGPVRLLLRGPGVCGHIDLAVAGCSAPVFEALDRVNAGFPAGVDTWLFGPGGSVAALPRSTRIIVEES